MENPVSTCLFHQGRKKKEGKTVASWRKKAKQGSDRGREVHRAVGGSGHVHLRIFETHTCAFPLFLSLS